MTQTQTSPSIPQRPKRLPLGSLLALATAGFLTAMLETMPAGILPALSSGMGVTEAAAGQTVTVYAIGSLAGAIPIIGATMGWPRRRLLVMALAGYVATSLVVAVSPTFALTLIARFVAGIFAGVLWGSSPDTPAAWWLQSSADAASPLRWRALRSPSPWNTCGRTPRRSLRLAAHLRRHGCRRGMRPSLVLAIVPDFPGQEKHEQTSALTAIRLPGIIPIIISSVVFITAHDPLYTYISSFLAPLGMTGSVSAVLLVFGAFALAGLWATGIFIDRHLRLLMLLSVVLFAVGVLAMGILSESPVAVFLSVAAWGFAFGGSGSVQQTALTNAAGSAVDAAQSVLVTGWNIGIAAGGVLGGVILAGPGTGALPWTTFALLIPVLIIVAAARRHGFPAPPSAKVTHEQAQNDPRHAQLNNGYGSQAAAWRAPGVDPSNYTNYDALVRYAQAAERGKIAFLFLPDTPALTGDLETKRPK